jgi:hypothetical protein
MSRTHYSTLLYSFDTLTRINHLEALLTGGNRNLRRQLQYYEADQQIVYASGTLFCIGLGKIIEALLSRSVPDRATLDFNPRQQAIVLLRAVLELVRAAFDPDNPSSKTMKDTVAVARKIIFEIIRKVLVYVIGECLP